MNLNDKHKKINIKIKQNIPECMWSNIVNVDE